MIRNLAKEDGYAALAALLTAACFALVAAQIADTSRSGVVGVNAAAVHARLAAGAEAGLATALDHVLADDPAESWQIDGRSYIEPIGDLTARIAIEDERGKIPLNSVSPAQARTMFQLAGASQSEAEVLAAALVKRREPQSAIAASADADPQRVDFQSIDELSLLPGMTSQIFDTLAHFITVDAGTAPFDRRFASPFALQVMGQAASGFDEIQRNRSLAGEQTAFASAPKTPLLPGRVVTVRVAVSDDRGDETDAAMVVEFTGRSDHPYLVRRVEG